MHHGHKITDAIGAAIRTHRTSIDLEVVITYEDGRTVTRGVAAALAMTNEDPAGIAFVEAYPPRSRPSPPPAGEGVYAMITTDEDPVGVVVMNAARARLYLEDVELMPLERAEVAGDELHQTVTIIRLS